MMDDCSIRSGGASITETITLLLFAVTGCLERGGWGKFL